MSEARPWIPRLVAADPPRRASDRVELAIWVLVLGLALLTPPRDTAGGFNAPFQETLEQATGGGLCMFRRATGIPCGGCGLTRAFVQLAHGELWSAIQLNPIAPLAFVWVVGRLLECAVLNATGRRLDLGIPNAWRWGFYVAAGAGLATLALIRLAAAFLGFPSDI
jgi:hypothetical protein